MFVIVFQTAGVTRWVLMAMPVMMLLVTVCVCPMSSAGPVICVR